MPPLDLENLVRVVRSDAELRRKLVCKACFIAALAEQAPSVVKIPGKEKRWRRDELASLAAATIARIEGKDQMHCVVGTDEFSANLRYARGSLVYLRADTTPPLRVLLYASLPPPPTPSVPFEPLPVSPGASEQGEAGEGGGEGGGGGGSSAAAATTTGKKQKQKKKKNNKKGAEDDEEEDEDHGAEDDDADDAAAATATNTLDAVGAAKLVDACGSSSELVKAVLEALAEDPPPPPPSSTPTSAAAAEKVRGPGADCHPANSKLYFISHFNHLSTLSLSLSLVTGTRYGGM